MAALLEVRNLRAGYGATQVLHGLDFSIEEGSITALLGANGAGKTTTLRALCNMVRTNGEVRFAGERIDGKSTEDIVRLGIAHVPDGRGTFTSLTTEENLRLGAFARRDKAALAEDYERVYRLYPDPERAARPAGRHAVGRPAADAGDLARPDAAAATAAAGRAFVRPGPPDREGNFRRDA